MGLRFNIDIGMQSKGSGQVAGDVRRVSGEAAKAGKTINTINASLTRMAGLVAAAFSVREVSQFVQSTIQEASRVQEMQNLLSVTFGAASEDVRQWAAVTAEEVERSRFALLEFAGDFAAFLKPLGTAPDQIVPMSQALTQLTVDVASFRNMAESDVFTRLMSGLAGETEAVRRLGVDLGATAIQQELLALGINKTAAEASQGEKVMARFNLIMRDTADAQGDAAATAGSLENTQKALSGITRDIRVEIGQRLLPVVTEIVQQLGEFAESSRAESMFSSIADVITIAARVVSVLARNIDTLILTTKALIAVRVASWAAESAAELRGMILAARGVTASQTVAVAQMRAARAGADAYSVAAAGLTAGLYKSSTAMRAFSAAARSAWAALGGPVGLAAIAVVAAFELKRIGGEQVRRQVDDLTTGFANARDRIREINAELRTLTALDPTGSGQLVPIRPEDAQRVHALREALEELKKEAAATAVVFDRFSGNQVSAEEAERQLQAGIDRTIASIEKQSKAMSGEAAAAAKAYQDRIADLKREIDPLGTEMAELRAEVDFAWEAFRAGDVTLHEISVRLLQLGERMDELTPKFEILDRHVRNLPKGVPHESKGVKEVADEVGVIVEQQEEARREQEKTVEGAQEWVRTLRDVVDLLGMADTELAGILGGIGGVLAGMEQISQAQKQGGMAGFFGQVGGAAQVGAGVFGVGQQLGAWKGSNTQGKFGGSGEGDYADIGATVGAIVGSFIPVIGTVLGGVIGGVLGGAIKKGADEGLAQLQLVGGQVETQITKSEGGLGEVVGGIGASIADAVTGVVDALGGELAALPDVQLKVRGDEIRARIDGVLFTFKETEEAINVLTREILRSSEIKGDIDEAMRQLLASGSAGDVEELAGFIDVVDQAINAEKMFIQGMSEIEIALEGSQQQIRQWTKQFLDMGLSADQAIRLAGANTVAYFSQLQQQITGEQASVAERQQIQRAQAELFNAQMDLEIARLEAERQALLAEAGLTEAEIKLLTEALDARAQGVQAEAAIAEREIQLNRNVLDGRKKFLQAKAGLYQAETELEQRFLQGAVEIIKIGGDTLGAILGSLPEEIRKQVEAITKIIAALKNVGKIDIGRLRLPGTPTVSPTPSAGTGPRDVEDTSRAARDAVEELMRSLDELTREMVANIDTLQSSLDDLETFRRGLLVGNLSPLPLQGQLAEAERQLRDAAVRARAGEIDAFGDVQALSQQYLQLLSSVFGTAGGGFQSGFRFVNELTGDLLEEGNRLVESERELLRAMRDQTANALEVAKDQLGLSEEQIKEIRTGWEQEVKATNNVRDEFRQFRNEMSQDNEALRRAITELAEAG